jgi:hypothetical protein
MVSVEVMKAMRVSDSSHASSPALSLADSIRTARGCLVCRCLRNGVIFSIEPSMFRVIGSWLTVGVSFDSSGAEAA